MQKLEERIRKVLLILLWFLAGAFLLTMTFCVFLQVLTRYVFHFAYSWPEELARFCFIWASLLGAGLALEQKKPVCVRRNVCFANACYEEKIEIVFFQNF